MLLENAKVLINLLENAGEKAYFVGGFVRDKIMQRACNDIDICTSATPAKVMEILKKNNIETYETGLKHGTVSAVMGGASYEITTFRTDGEYADYRRPAGVTFISSIEDDLQRRDFTMNAIAYHPKGGFIDLFGGRADINAGLIRTVGDPDTRFKEDALRILRAVRFSSELGFEIESKTKKALFENKALLKNIAYERIFAELKKLLLGKNVLDVLLNYGEILAVVIPELTPCLTCAQNTPWHIYNVWQHTAYSVSYVPRDTALRLAMLFHDIGKPLVKTTDENGVDHFKKHAEAGAEITYKALRRFNAPNALTDKVTTLVKYHQSLADVSKINVRHMLIKHKAEMAKALFEVRMADLKAHDEKMVSAEYQALTLKYDELLFCLEKHVEIAVSDLMISGADLKAIGFRGREIGAALDTLLYAVADGCIENNPAALKAHAKALLPGNGGNTAI